MESKKLAQLIAGAREGLEEAGYGKATIQLHERVWRNLEAYARENEVSYYSDELMVAFLAECEVFSEPRGWYRKKEAIRALNKLDEYRRHGKITTKRPSRKEYVFVGELGPSVERYIAFKKANVSPARIQSIKLYLERFCAYADNVLRTGLEGLDAGVIQGFIASCRIYPESTVNQTACCLRGYLSYLFKEGLTQSDCSSFVPHMLRKRDSAIPTTYRAKDIEKLLGSIDRNNPLGKRNYAMILLAARLGLRSSDICGLTFESIDWENSKILIQQQKTGEPADYPILKDVGMAIIDYLKYGRKDADEPYVFLREIPPYSRLGNHTLFTIVDTCMKRAGIHVPAGKRRGPHVLRHSLSSRLLENDVPLPIISDILAHKSTETTKIYLKIAEKQLLECSLTVPPMQWEVSQ